MNDEVVVSADWEPLYALPEARDWVRETSPGGDLVLRFCKRKSTGKNYVIIEEDDNE